jgi:hypothetical protein
MSDEELVKMLLANGLDECDEAVDRIEALTAKLAKAVEALREALYFLKPTESDMEKKAGIYRIVTTLAEIEGGMRNGD